MHEDTVLIFIVLVVLGYGFFSKFLYRYNISGPMVFTTIGILLSPIFFGTDAIDLNSMSVQLVAQIALILVLFSDASTLEFTKLKKEWKIPFRLLVIGLPITIIFGTYVGVLFFPHIELAYIILMAMILTPTDAALGKSVVSDKNVPHSIRSTINIESGLNDGIVFPLVITIVTVIVGGLSLTSADDWLSYVMKVIVLGTIFGSLVGFLGAKFSLYAMSKNSMDNSYKNLIPIALAIFSYYLSEHFGGNGFIAAYFAGLFVGNFNKDSKERIENFAESEGELLVGLSFLVFGLAFVPDSIAYWDMKTFLYAILSLTVLRMLPVYISLIGTKLDFSTKLFIGWFGPRGIASILYVLIVVHKIGSIEGHETIYAVISLTILLSIFLHGFSANPLVKLKFKKD